MRSLIVMVALACTVTHARAQEVTSTDVERILARFVALEEAVNKLADSVAKQKAGPIAKPSPKPKPLPLPTRETPSAALQTTLVQNCFNCHSSSATAKDSGGFRMYEPPKDGERFPRLRYLSALEWVKIDYAVYSGDMPKFQDSLSSDDSSEIRAYVNTLRGEVYLLLSPDTIKSKQVGAK